MTIAVLSSGKGWHVEDLARAALSCGVEVEVVDFRQLRGTVSTNEPCTIDAAGLDLARADAVLVRTMPGGSLEQVVFRMDALHALEARAVPVINPPRALECAIDKYLSLCRLADAGLPVPTTIACESTDAARSARDTLGGDVVLKPLFGSEGRGIVRLANSDDERRELDRAFAEDRVLYLQRFVDHGGEDRRLLVIGGEVVASMRRLASPGEWITNVARGGSAERHAPSDDEADLARRAARAVDAPIAGVDLVRDRNGEIFVLEVNAVPGWRSLASTCELDVAELVLQYVMSRGLS